MRITAFALASFTFFIVGCGVKVTAEISKNHTESFENEDSNIFSELQNITVSLGENVTIRCNADDPKTMVVWTRSCAPDFPSEFVVIFRNSTRVHVFHKDWSLNIRNITASDSGEYVCKTSKSERRYTLNVHGVVPVAPALCMKPKGRSQTMTKENSALNLPSTYYYVSHILSQPLDVKAHIGQDVILPCKLTDRATTLWKHSHLVIFMNSNQFFLKEYGRHSVSDERSLVIRNISTKDAGEYTCEVRLAKPNLPIKIVHKLQVDDYKVTPWESIKPSKIKIAHEGENVTMACDSAPDVFWVVLYNSRESTILLLKIGTPQTSYDSKTITVMNASKYHSGQYICYSRKQFGVATYITMYTLKVIVSTEPSSSSEEPDEVPSTHVPQFLTEPMSLAVREGEDINIPCKVDDLEEFVIIWKHGTTVLFAGKIRIYSDPRVNIVDGQYLQLTNVSVSDGGQYICQLSTTPSKEIIHTLTVQVPPSVETKPEGGYEVAKKGQKVSLTCEVSGNPRPSVTWKRADGSPLGKDVMIDNGQLTIKMATRSHSGKYECIADNNVGEPATGNLMLLVQHEPEIEVPSSSVPGGEHQSTQLMCKVFAEPSATVRWIGPQGMLITTSEKYKMESSPPMYTLVIRKVSADDFGNYTCIANNTFGEDMAVLEVTGRPGEVKFTSDPDGYRPTSYDLRWSVMSFKPITEYHLKYRKTEGNKVDGEEPWIEVDIPAEDKPGIWKNETYEIQDLEAATSYEAVIKARNVNGWGVSSRPFVFSTEGKRDPTPGTGEMLINSAPSDDTQGNGGGLNSMERFRKAQLFGILTSVVLSIFFLC